MSSSYSSEVVYEKLEDIRRNTISINHGLETMKEIIEELKATMEQLSKTEQKHFTFAVKVELGKIESEISELQKVIEEYQKTLTQTIQKYKLEYRSILVDYVNGILDALKTFTTFIDESLEKLKRIAESGKTFREHLKNIDPVRDNTKVYTAAIKLYSDRSQRLEKFSTTIIKILESIKNDIEKIKDTLSNALFTEENLGLNEPLTSHAVLYIPLLAITSSQTDEISLIGPIKVEQRVSEVMPNFLKNIHSNIGKEEIKGQLNEKIAKIDILSPDRKRKLVAKIKKYFMKRYKNMDIVKMILRGIGFSV